MRHSELTIATAPTRTATRWTNSTTDLQALTEQAYNPKTVQYSVAEYEALPKTKRDEVKDSGGYVSGHLRDGRRRKGHALTKSFITLDADTIPQNVDLPALLHQQPYRWVAHTSLSHTPQAPRWRVWIFTNRDMGPDEYEATARRLANDLGLELFDPTTFQPERFFYHPATLTDGQYEAHTSTAEAVDLDVDATLARYADWTDISTWAGITAVDMPKLSTGTPGKTSDPLSKPGMIGAFNRAHTIPQAINTFLPEVYTPGQNGRYTYTGGTSANGLIVYGPLAFSQHASDPAADGHAHSAFDLVRIHLHGHLDTDTDPTTPSNKQPSYLAMLDMANNDPDTRKENASEVAETISQVFAPVPDQPDGAEDGAEDEAEDEAGEETPDEEESGKKEDPHAWLQQLETQKNGTFKDSFENFLLIFTHDPRYNHIAWNAHQGALAVQDPQALPWTQIKPGWSETDLAQLKQSISDTYQGLYGPTKMHDALMAAAANRAFHPVRDYFHTLPQWDGIPRLDTLLVDYLGADDTPYTRAVTRKTLVAAVRRTHRPGTKFDQVLTLVGPQGIGKSTILAKLAGQWFSDNLSITDMKDSKTAAEKLAGNLIIEIAELAGMRKAEAETVKSFISRTEDKYRPAYGRVVETYPRECIITASTNATDGFLRDPTGNRRWWAVPVAGHGNHAAHTMSQATIDQIWAETKHHEAKGETLYLEGDIAEAAAEAQTDAAEHDDRTGIVADYLEHTLPGNWDALPLAARRSYLAGEVVPSEYANTGMWDKAGPRETVSKIEIWSECFGRDPDAMRRQDSYEIAAIMAQIDGWEDSGDRHRLPIYGRQRVYYRTGVREAAAA